MGFYDTYCMNFFNNFLYNLDNVSLIQKCIDLGWSKPLYAITNYILKVKNAEAYRETITSDLC